MRALRSVVGETRVLHEHRNSANFHVLCPDIIVDSRTAARIQEKQLAVLASEHPEVDCNINPIIGSLASRDGYATLGFGINFDLAPYSRYRSYASIGNSIVSQRD